MRRGRPGSPWAALAALSGILAAVPLWTSRFLPFQDAPQHLAAVAMLAGRDHAAELTRRWFDIDFTHAQYAGFYLPAAALARHVGADTAIRIFLTVAAISLPIAAWMLLRAFGRDPRLSLFAAALFHTAPLYIGLYHFVAAVPVALLLVAMVERQLQSPRALRAALCSLLAVALVYLHVSGLVIAAGAACALAATARGRVAKRVIRGVLPLAPALALLVALRAPAAFPQDAAGNPMKSAAEWQSPFAQLWDVLRFGNVIPGRADELAVVALTLLWIAIARSKGPKLQPDRPWRLPLLAAGLLAAYLAVPTSVGYVAYIHLRAVPFLLAFAFGSAIVAPTRRTSLLFCAALAVQTAYCATLVHAYRAFDAEAGARDLEQVLALAEPGRRVVSLMLDRKSHAVHFEPYLHFGLYYEVLRGGRVRFNFGELPWMPIRFRNDPPVRKFPLHWEFEPGWFDWTTARGDADYVLVRTADPFGDPADSPEPGVAFAEGWDLVGHAGRWEIFAPISEIHGRRAPERAPGGASRGDAFTTITSRAAREAGTHDLPGRRDPATDQ